MTKFSSVILSAFILFIATCQPAFAVKVTTSYSGLLVNDLGPIPSQFDGIFKVGDAFSGQFEYDTNLAAKVIQSDTNYYDGFTNLSFVIGTYKWTTPLGWGEVSNGNSGHDAFGVNVGASPSSVYDLNGPSINGFSLWGPQLQFFDNTGTAFSSKALPIINDLSAFTGNYETFLFSNSDHTRNISFFGKVLSIANVVDSPFNPVPEPQTLALFILGLLTMIAITTKRFSR